MKMLERRERAALSQGTAFTTPQGSAAQLLLGADALDLLQRLSASDLSGLGGEALHPALFCDEKGRLIAMSLLLAREDGLLALCSRGEAQRFKEWIERFIIMEDVTLQSLPEIRVLYLLGAEAVRRAAELAGANAPLAIPRSFGGEGLWICEDADAASEAISRLGRSELAVVRDESARLWNLQRGIPTPGFGLVEHFHPLEVGLGEFVSVAKGCYVGQEVLARLANYDKVRRGLAVLRGEGAAPERHVAVRHDSKVVGRVVDAMTTEGGYVAVATVDLRLDTGSVLVPDTATAGTLDRIPAA